MDDDGRGDGVIFARGVACGLGAGVSRGIFRGREFRAGVLGVRHCERFLQKTAWQSRGFFRFKTRHAKSSNSNLPVIASAAKPRVAIHSRPSKFEFDAVFTKSAKT